MNKDLIEDIVEELSECCELCDYKVSCGLYGDDCKDCILIRVYDAAYDELHPDETDEHIQSGLVDFLSEGNPDNVVNVTRIFHPQKGLMIKSGGKSFPLKEIHIEASK